MGDSTDDLRLLLASRRPVIAAQMDDEQRFLATLRLAAQALNTDFGHALADPVVVRQVKEFGQAAPPGRTIVLAGPARVIPPELDGLALPWSLEPPSREELEGLVRRTIDDLVARDLSVALGEDDVRRLVEAVRGLTLPEAERLILQAAFRDDRLTSEDVAFVRGAKAELLEADGILELIETDLGDLGDVGGMANLKEWLRVRGRALEPAAAEFGLEPMEKGLAGGPGAGDSGVSRRVLGTFLRWMQERPAGVFLVATCNDVTSLPPELLRRGRFDEVFFVDLPDPAEREQILAIQLRRRPRDPAAFDLVALGAASEGFSGGELEGAVVGAMYRAYADEEDLTTERVLAELSATSPLSRTRAEDVARLRAWAADRAVAA